MLNTKIPGTTLQGTTLESFLGVKLEHNNPMALALREFAYKNQEVVSYDDEDGCVTFGLEDVTFIIAADLDFDLKPCLRVTIRTYCPTTDLFVSALQYSLEDALKQLKVGIANTMKRPPIKCAKVKTTYPVSNVRQPNLHNDEQ